MSPEQRRRVCSRCPKKDGWAPPGWFGGAQAVPAASRAVDLQDNYSLPWNW
jgi:hypothetical protein